MLAFKGCLCHPWPGHLVPDKAHGVRVCDFHCSQAPGPLTQIVSGHGTGQICRSLLAEHTLGRCPFCLAQFAVTLEGGVGECRRLTMDEAAMHRYAEGEELTPSSSALEVFGLTAFVFKWRGATCYGRRRTVRQHFHLPGPRG